MAKWSPTWTTGCKAKDGQRHIPTGAKDHSDVKIAGMSDSVRPVGSVPSEQVNRFHEAYDVGTPPWDIGRPQPAFLELAEDGTLAGRVLDVGCGTGEHALMAAARGFDAIGIDAVPRAIGLAQRKARERGLAARFLVWDALKLSDLNEHFDTVLDSGLFHSLDGKDLARFVPELAAVIPIGGRYHMLCFSDRQPGTLGPRRVSEAEIKAAFQPPEWRVDAIAAVTIDTNLDDIGIRAWRASITRT
jgi:SAM-dependent methyltransferase